MYSKRTTNYLPALQVWQTDRPYPQRDVSYIILCVLLNSLYLSSN